MLFKILGSIIVILSSTFLGFALANECKNRPLQLRELHGLLQMFENQISYLSDVISEAFERIGRVSKSAVSVFFIRTVELLREDKTLNASQAWEKAVNENIKKTSLNQEDKDILLAFGKLLGSSELEGQIKNIRLTMTQLKLQEEKAETNRAKNEKMYKSLGILGGIAVVIVLL